MYQQGHGNHGNQGNACPQILRQISIGVQVRVWFDGGPASGRRGVFLGIQDGTAAFLITQTGGPQVVYVPCFSIQAVSLTAVGG